MLEIDSSRTSTWGKAPQRQQPSSEPGLEYQLLTCDFVSMHHVQECSCKCGRNLRNRTRYRSNVQVLLRPTGRETVVDTTVCVFTDWPCLDLQRKASVPDVTRRPHSHSHQLRALLTFLNGWESKKDPEESYVQHLGALGNSVSVNMASLGTQPRLFRSRYLWLL